MTPKEKRTLLRIILSFVIFAAGLFAPLEGYYRLILFLPAYALVGYDILYMAARNIKNGQIFDENFLMCIATIGAFLLGEYPEGVAVMLFYQVGELFQSYAVGRSRRSIASLMDIRPDYANVEKDGELIRIDPDEVKIGDIITVKPGEKIPLDGVVVSGHSTADTSALTGESVPRELSEGAEALSGCVNLSGLLKIRVTSEFSESTVQKILDLVENAGSRKARAENFITKFARYYTPVVVFAAAALALIPPLVLPGATFSDWVGRALTFLVISCPCALVISVPLSFFGGIGGASKCGILVKGGNYLEALAKAETVVFDKTGTLTAGDFKVTGIHPATGDEGGLLALAALAESYSDHPIALSIRRAFGEPVDKRRVSEVTDIPGGGVKCTVDGQRVLLGNRRLMEEAGITLPKEDPYGTVVHVTADGVYQGRLVISDEIKADAAPAIRLLKKESGVRKTVMLTGDRAAVADEVARMLSIDTVYSELLPDGKVSKVEALLQEKSPKTTLVFVGDGINDAPVLSRADVGIAMGALGSDAAIEAADVVIMDDHPSKISTAISIARRTLRIVYQNIVFALTVKLLFLALGALGLTSMWGAVFADVGVSVIAILNAMRALRVPKAPAGQAEPPSSPAGSVPADAFSKS